MRTFPALAFALGLAALAAAPLDAATVTTKTPLTNAGWTDLGAGPLLLSFRGSGVYQIADATPSIVSEGFTIPQGGSVNLNTSSHVWAMAQGASGVDAYTAPSSGPLTVSGPINAVSGGASSPFNFTATGLGTNQSVATFSGGDSVGEGGQIKISNTNAGVVAPNKYIRVANNSSFQIVNSNYSAIAFSLDDLGTIVTSPVAFASLPACAGGVKGSFAWINNASAAPTYWAAAAGGGTTAAPVFCDGTTWRYH